VEKYTSVPEPLSTEVLQIFLSFAIPAAFTQKGFLGSFGTGGGGGERGRAPHSVLPAEHGGRLPKRVSAGMCDRHPG